MSGQGAVEYSGESTATIEPKARSERGVDMSTPDLARGQTERQILANKAFFLKAKALTRGITFSCFLDEPPLELVPRASRAALSASVESASLQVNPTLRYQPESELPDELRQRGLSKEGLRPGYALAWVKDPGTELWMAYWIHDEYRDLLRSLRPGQPAPAGLGQPIVRLLAQADLLVPHDYHETRRAQWERAGQVTRGQFQAHGYDILRNLFRPLQLAAMRQYYRELLSAGVLTLGDNQVAKRYSLHSEVLASFFHCQLASLVSQIAGEPVKPSYVYFASYEAGAVLRRHLDRAPCQFSISLLVDYIPEPEGTSGWPLFLEREGPPKMVATADLGIGDGVIYKGCELAHYRDALPEGHLSTSLFFHYVPLAFDGKLW
jgi:hypothetical protein